MGKNVIKSRGIRGRVKRNVGKKKKDGEVKNAIKVLNKNNNLVTIL